MWYAIAKLQLRVGEESVCRVVGFASLQVLRCVGREINKYLAERQNAMDSTGSPKLPKFPGLAGSSPFPRASISTKYLS